MKKKINVEPWVKYLGLVLTGIFFGWLIFGGSATEQHTAVDHEHEEGTTWTCSMHPQIRQAKPGQCPICGMNLIPVAQSGAIGEADPYVHEMTPEAIALSNIRTSKVQMISAENEISLSGKIQANEQKIATISSNFPGRIERLYVNFTGDEVKKGQRLATIYSPELITAQKELIEAAKTKERNALLYNAAKEKLRSWRITDRQIENIEAKGEVQTNFDIFANVSGIVTSRNISEGDYIGRGTTMFNIADLSKVWILLDAYESDLSWINKGDKIKFQVSAIPGEEMTATVSFVDPIINPETRAASIRAEADNPGLRLKPGMFVNGKISSTLNLNENSLAIPKTSLLWTGRRSVVYVKIPDATMPAFEMREITLGSRTGDLYLVQDGLEMGEEIVTNGVFAVDAAAQLSGNYSMMGRPENIILEVPEAFQKQLTEVAEAYFEVKNALVDSNPEKAAESSQILNKAIINVDMTLLKGKSHEAWMKSEGALKTASKNISNTKDLEMQRKHFQHLSNNLLNVIEDFGLKKDTIYKAYCPMTDDDRGGYWLSEFKEIRNPYFGEAMLTCGEVRETYRKNGTAQKAPPRRAGGESQHIH